MTRCAPVNWWTITGRVTIYVFPCTCKREFRSTDDIAAWRARDRHISQARHTQLLAVGAR